MGTDLPSIGFEAAKRAIDAGGELTPIPASFYSGGYRYTHLLTTRRGTQYRVSSAIAKWLLSPTTTSKGGA